MGVATRSSGRSTARRGRSRSIWSGSTSCQVFRADGDRARGFKTVLVSETDRSVLGALVAAGPHHRLGRHLRARAAPHARCDRERHAGRTVRRDLRGRLPRRGDLRCNRPLRARAVARRSRTARNVDESTSLERRLGRVGRADPREWAGRVHAHDASLFELPPPAEGPDARRRLRRGAHLARASFARL